MCVYMFVCLYVYMCGCMHGIPTTTVLSLFYCHCIIACLCTCSECHCICIWLREGRCHISSSIPGQHLKLIRSVWSYSIAPICGGCAEYIAELCGWDDIGHPLLITLAAGWGVGEEWLLWLGTRSPVPKSVAVLLG
jgi:hypothetical protein